MQLIYCNIQHTLCSKHCITHGPIAYYRNKKTLISQTPSVTGSSDGLGHNVDTLGNLFSTITLGASHYLFISIITIISALLCITDTITIIFII